MLNTISLKELDKVIPCIHQLISGFFVFHFSYLNIQIADCSGYLPNKVFEDLIVISLLKSLREFIAFIKKASNER